MCFWREIKVFVLFYYNCTTYFKDSVLTTHFLKKFSSILPIKELAIWKFMALCLKLVEICLFLIQSLHMVKFMLVSPVYIAWLWAIKGFAQLTRLLLLCLNVPSIVVNFGLKRKLERPLLKMLLMKIILTKWVLSCWWLFYANFIQS